jgi:cytochrome c biogenesis protein CcmG, thiol:disulfide interchange protein DsbE
MSESISQSSTQDNMAVETRRPRWGRILAWGGLAVFLVVIGLALYTSQRGRVAVGQKAPTFGLTTFDGQPYNLPELRGKVILVNFWASWCIPCANEADYLQQAWQHYQDRGDVVFLGVDYTDTEKAARAYMDRFNITYANGPDLGTRISQMYRMTGVPETFIIDQNGNISYFQYGEFQSLEDIQAKIDPLLSKTH